MNTEKMLKKLAAEPRVQTGTGKATFKTATSAAKAAQDARDESRLMLHAIKQHLIEVKEIHRLSCCTAETIGKSLEKSCKKNGFYILSGIISLVAFIIAEIFLRM